MKTRAVQHFMSCSKRNHNPSFNQYLMKKLDFVLNVFTITSSEKNICHYWIQISNILILFSIIHLTYPHIYFKVELEKIIWTLKEHFIVFPYCFIFWSIHFRNEVKVQNCNLLYLPIIIWKKSFSVDLLKALLIGQIQIEGGKWWLMQR